MITAGNLAPGDVIAVRTGGWAAVMIRLGAALAGKPDLQNHIAVVHHRDFAGTLWCVEGRPGGVGWRDARDYVSSSMSMSNAAQPKTDAQRKMVTSGAVALLGTAYDWEAIAADAAADLNISGLWKPAFGKSVPGHLVCSSLAEYLYLKARLACPDARMGRDVQPADWTALWVSKGWA